MLPDISEIKRRRKMLNLTQSELAKASAVSQSLLAKLEAGQIEISYEKAKRIFKTLDELEKENSVSAKDLMSKNVFFVSKNDSLKKAINLMSGKKISQLPVMDSGKIIGSVSERLLSQKISDGFDLHNSTVEKVMEESFPLVQKDLPIKAIASLLKYSPAVLVAEKGKIIGIISKADLLKTI